MTSRPYPLGIVPAAIPGQQEPLQGRDPGDDPSYASAAVVQMAEHWTPINVCLGGTREFREQAAYYLPLEPAEDADAWKRRIYHATMTPFLGRLAEQAAGLILRKPITLTAQDGKSPADPYWEAFAKDVDGQNTDIDEFARRVLISALLYGHASILTDYPATEPVQTLADERMRGMRPYWVPIDCRSILGWRMSSTLPGARLSQVRIEEYVTEELGEFGEDVVRQIRVIEQGKWAVYRLGNGGWVRHQNGTTSLEEVPLATVYANKVAELTSKPPMLEVAYLNIAHAQRTADLVHCLHVASMPLLVLKGFDENEGKVGLSANTAIALPPEGDAHYISPEIGAFDSQQAYISQLEEQMSNLALTTLFAQKAAAETAASKKLSRTDSDSMLSVISQDLEETLQLAMNHAAAFVGLEPPLVNIDRDLSLQALDAEQVDQYSKLWLNNAISHSTLLGLLKKGEILPGIDVEAEIEAAQQEQGSSMMMQKPGDAGRIQGILQGKVQSDEDEDEDEAEAEGEGEGEGEDE